MNNNLTERSTTVREVPDVVYVLNDLPKPLELSLTYDDIEHTPAGNVPFLVTFANGEQRAGNLCKKGKTTLYGVPQTRATIEFGDKDLAEKAKIDINDDYKALDAVLNDVAKEQVNKAIADIKPELITGISQEAFEQLKLIVNTQLAELKIQGEAFDDLDFFEQSLVSLKALAEGAEDGITGYIPDLGEFGTLMEKADISILTLMEALASGEIDILQRKLDLLSDADRAVMNLQQASATMETLLLLISDPENRKYLVSLPRRFLEAMPPDQHAQWLASVAVQKGIDIGMVAGGTAIATVASAPAAGSAGPLTAVLLSGVVVARSGGKALEQLIAIVTEIAKKKKAMLNQHNERPHQTENETEIPRETCPICHRDGKECKNRKKLKKGEGYENNPKKRHLKMMKIKNPGFPLSHDWYLGENSLAVHHVIPLESVKSWSDRFDDFSYDINQVHNTVVLPAKAKLACHLHVQCHQGNHELGVALVGVAGSEPLKQIVKYEKNKQYKEIYDFQKNLFQNNQHFRYPKAVIELLESIEYGIEKGKYCKNAGNEKELKIQFERTMKNISKKILSFIDAFLWTIAWDSRDYKQYCILGCCNVNGITQKRKGKNRENKCAKKRDHKFVHKTSDMPINKKSTILKLGQ